MGSTWWPRGAQECQRCAQDAPKTAPREPKRAPRAPKSRPRGAQEATKSLQKRLRGAPGRNFKALLAANLVQGAVRSIFARLLRRMQDGRQCILYRKNYSFFTSGAASHCQPASKKKTRKIGPWDLRNLARDALDPSKIEAGAASDAPKPSKSGDQTK